MMTLRSVLLVVTALLCGLAVQHDTARADNGGAYPAGWNMVSGPPGTDFSPAVEMFAYASSAYVVPAGSRAVLCAGYWAYFNQPTSVPLTGQPPATSSQTCPLAAGWNMVGNPFDTVAELPANIVAYHWNADTGRYDLVTGIPMGAAVWIYSPGSGTILLQEPNAPPPGPTAHTVVITAPFQADYQVHVGDLVELRLLGPQGAVVNVDPAYLMQVNTGDMPVDPPPYIWRWQTLMAGTTYITINPACRQANPPCAAPSLSIRIDITP